MPRHPAAIRDEVVSETRQRLLEAAAAEFARKGFSGANINHISNAAGFAKGTIYNHFASKRALMLALIDAIAEEHTRFIRDQVIGEVEPHGRLERFFSAGYAYVAEHPVHAQVAINAVFGHDAEFKQRIFDAYSALFALINDDIVESGIASGAFRPTDADFATACLMSLYLGSCSILDPNGDSWFNARQMAAFVLSGLSQSPGQVEPKSPTRRPISEDAWKQW